MEEIISGQKKPPCQHKAVSKLIKLNYEKNLLEFLLIIRAEQIKKP